MREEAPTITIDENGDKFWRNKEGELHRIDGPAIECSDGDKEWYKMGKLHRIDGPAVEYKNGDRYWYRKGKLHRIEGPAIEYRNGDKFWYIRDVYFATKEAFFDSLNDEEKKIAIFSEDFLNA